MGKQGSRELLTPDRNMCVNMEYNKCMVNLPHSDYLIEYLGAALCGQLKTLGPVLAILCRTYGYMAALSKVLHRSCKKSALKDILVF